MKPNVLLIGSFAYAYAGGLAQAQAPHIFGSWKLNVEASEYPGRPPRSEVRTYLPLDEGFLLGLAVTIDADGNARFLQFAAKPDGLDYPEYDGILLARLQMSGEPTRATYSETQLDDYAVEVVDKFDGEPYLTAVRRVSEDGQTMTVDVDRQGPDGETSSYTLVYDRQTTTSE